MEHFKILSLPMKALIDHCIRNSVEFCADMRMDMSEQECENMTVKDFRIQVLDNATEFFSQELESWELSGHITSAIKVRVDDMSLAQLIGAEHLTKY
jgi:hypothetical protein